MNSWSLVWVMIMKEIRTTFRERSQIGGIAVSVLVLVVVLGGTFYRARAHAHPSRSKPPISILAPKTKAVLSTLPSGAVRWASIGIAATVGFFFSMGYLMSAVLASFVGEKEAKTLEILLASPLSDGKLYAIKCISVLLPSAALGYFFAVAIALVTGAFIPADVIDVPAGLLFVALILSLPILILLQLWFVGLGAAISVKAETMKGANQILGVALMVLIFGVGYGTPFLWMLVPSLHPPLIHLGTGWMKLSFITQYGSALLVFGIPAIAFLSIGRASFRRDRMLT